MGGNGRKHADAAAGPGPGVRQWQRGRAPVSENAGRRSQELLGGAAEREEEAGREAGPPGEVSPEGGREPQLCPRPQCDWRSRTRYANAERPVKGRCGGARCGHWGGRGERHAYRGRSRGKEERDKAPAQDSLFFSDWEKLELRYAENSPQERGHSRGRTAAFPKVETGRSGCSGRRQHRCSAHNPCQSHSTGSLLESPNPLLPLPSASLLLPTRRILVATPP